MKFRDDDIQRDTDLSLFKQFHEVYKKNNEIHTIAVIAMDLWKNRELTWYLETESLLDIQYHGLDHVDYSKMSKEQCKKDLLEGKLYLEEKLHRPIKVFYPPWNIEDQMVRDVCSEIGLKYDNARIEVDDYLNGGNGERVNLHYWKDLDVLEKVLTKEPKSNARKQFEENIRKLVELTKKDGKVLHVGKTHVYDYRAYFPWAEFVELDNDEALNPDIVSSVEKMPIKDNYFDAVICFGVFEYLKDRVSAVKEINRVLKKDSYAIIGIPDNIKPTDAINEITKTFSIPIETITFESDMKKFPNNSKTYNHFLVRKK